MAANLLTSTAIVRPMAAMSKTAATRAMRNAWSALPAMLLLSWPMAAQAQTPCTATGTNQTCTNAGLLSGINAGIVDGGTLTLTNTATGTIRPTGPNSFGVNADTANVSNSGTISGGLIGILASAANVTNSGTITGGDVGIHAETANVTNSGTIQATGHFAVEISGIVTNSGIIQAAGANGAGIHVLETATVTNFGTIQGTGPGAVGIVGDTANVTNSGTISGVDSGISLFGSANVTNHGTIRATDATRSFGIAASLANVTNYGTIQALGAAGIGISTAFGANVVNAGTISGTDAALDFSSAADTLTLLRGSKIVGAINLRGGPDTVNFRNGNHNLTFDSLAQATVTGTAPFAVSGDRAAAVDLTSFATGWRSLADFTRGVADAVPVFSAGVPGGGAPLAFAGSDASSRIGDAFASIPGLASAYAGEAAVFKAPAVTYADGTTIWARGFAGQRTQQQDGVLLRNTNLFYGGMLGADYAFRRDLRVGAFLGGGQTRTRIDGSQGDIDSDLLFAGAYARYDIGASFVHGAIQGGSSRNTMTRTINNNLVANGLETATASYDGWYVSPEATFGHRFALGRMADAAYTLTPSLRVRYLHGSFDGYTESGTTAPLTVAGQTVSVWEERAEAKLTRTATFSPQSQLSTSLVAGVLGTQRSGNTVNATLLGQAIAFATPGSANVWGGYGGLGLEWNMRNVTLFSAAEYLALSDRSNVVSGRAGLRVGF
jgi:hypothetical protein